MKGRDEQARRSLARVLRNDPDSQQVNEELAEIAANLHHERSVGSTSYIDCFRSGPGRNALRTWTGIGLQALQQLTGINFIFYYGYVTLSLSPRRVRADDVHSYRTQFFKNSGITNPFIITIATNVVNVGATVPGIWAGESRTPSSSFSVFRADVTLTSRSRQTRTTSSPPLRCRRNGHFSSTRTQVH